MTTDKPLTFMGIPIHVSEYLPEGMEGVMFGVDPGNGPARSAFTVATRGTDGQITSMAHRVDPGGPVTLADLANLIELFRSPPPPPQPPMAILSPRQFVWVVIDPHFDRGARRARRAVGDMRRRYAAAVASVPAEHRKLAQAEIDKVKARALRREQRRARVVRRAKHGWRT